MRALNVMFEDEEYAEFLKQKGDTPWRKFLMKLLRDQKSKKKE